MLFAGAIPLLVAPPVEGEADRAKAKGLTNGFGAVAVAVEVAGIGCCCWAGEAGIGPVLACAEAGAGATEENEGRDSALVPAAVTVAAELVADEGEGAGETPN